MQIGSILEESYTYLKFGKVNSLLRKSAKKARILIVFKVV